MVEVSAAEIDLAEQRLTEWPGRSRSAAARTESSRAGARSGFLNRVEDCPRVEYNDPWRGRDSGTERLLKAGSARQIVGNAMLLLLTIEMEDFVRSKVESGEFPSEEAVVQAALARLRDECAALDCLIDHEFVELCVRQAGGDVALERVLQATSTVPGSMAEAIIEDERADRI